MMGKKGRSGIVILICVILFFIVGYTVGKYKDINSSKYQSIEENDFIEEIVILGSDNREIYEMLNECREKLLYTTYEVLDSAFSYDVTNELNQVLAMQEKAYSEEGCDYNDVIKVVSDTNNIISRFNELLREVAIKKQATVKIDLDRASNRIKVYYINIDRSNLQKYSKTCAILFMGFGLVFGLFVCMLINKYKKE